MTALVLDIGSSSVRVMLFDAHAKPIPGTFVSHANRFETTPPGASVADAAQLQQVVESCIDEVLRHPLAGKIQIVGMATFAGNLLGVSEGRALTPVYTYGETRSDADVITLAHEIDIAAAYQRTGCPHNSAYAPGRLRWLKRTQPQLFNAVETWMDFGAYLYLQWFGQTRTSYSIAAWSGLLNRVRLNWDEEWLRVLGMNSEQFPPLSDYNAMLTGLLPAYAERWPCLRDVPFCLAVGDGAAANVGSGCVTPERVALTVGTTAALRVVTDTPLPPVPDGLWSYRVDRWDHLIGGATSEGGNVFGWAQSVLKLDADLQIELLNRPADAHGLTVLPLLAGERSPGFAAHASGAIVGLKLSTTTLDIIQAMLESVALRLSLIAEQLKPMMREKAIIIGGGGALNASRPWARMIANALNRPLHITAETEITARGVAIMALRTLGLCGLGDYPPTVADIVEPDRAEALALRAARERQTALYQKLIASDGA